MKSQELEILSNFEGEIIPREVIEKHFKSINSLLTMMVDKGYVLHGSQRLVPKLKPQKASCCVLEDGCLNAVYATTNPEVAIFSSIIPKVGRTSYKGTRFIASRTVIDRISPGYIYVLDGTDFKPKDGGNFVCEQEVMPVFTLPVKVSDFNRKIICREDIKVDWKKMESLVRKYLPKQGIHGIEHTQQVVANVKLIAEEECVDQLDDAIMGAYLHDIGRVDDSGGNAHAIQGAVIATKILSKLVEKFDVTRILYAIKHHADGQTTKDPLIGAIWDADRLDIGRTGVKIRRELLSTSTGQKIYRNRRSF